MKVFIGPYPKSKSKSARRISVRIDSHDTWSLDHTLALIILPCLKKIKKQKIGAPSSMFDLSHHQMKDWKSKAFKAAEKKSNDAGFKKWYSILDDMIYSFAQIVKPSDNKFFTKKKYDKVGHRAYKKKVQHGLELFGKHFQALWT